VIERTLARRYAVALLEQAERAHVVEEMEAQLLALKAAYEKDPALRTALHHPKIPRAQKHRMLAAVFAERAHGSLTAFLSLLVRKHRLNLIPQIADLFDRLADRSRGVVRVEVAAYAPLTEPQQSNLSARLSRLLGGKKIDLRIATDRRILGGLRVRIGDTVYDGSVAGRLKALRESMEAQERLAVRFGG
jgi:F-type H+-transporting ATPase subunit delta